MNVLEESDCAIVPMKLTTPASNTPNLVAARTFVTEQAGERKSKIKLTRCRLFGHVVPFPSSVHALAMLRSARILPPECAFCGF
jgi:hypothetical protein